MSETLRFAGVSDKRNRHMSLQQAKFVAKWWAAYGERAVPPQGRHEGPTARTCVSRGWLHALPRWIDGEECEVFIPTISGLKALERYLMEQRLDNGIALRGLSK